jgi:putative YhbY family RNA-binding protein
LRLRPTLYDVPMPPVLTARQRSALKARAHALEPVVHIGASGASETVIAEVDRSLTAHGLIKVRLAGADRQAREELTSTLCDRTGAAAVQNVGRILVLWRPRRDDDPLEQSEQPSNVR